MICNICNKPLDETQVYILRSTVGCIGDCCLSPLSVDEARTIVDKHYEENVKVKTNIDRRNWYLITFTSEIGHKDAISVIKASLTKFYKSKMFKGEKYHAWEINEQGMIHAHALFITTGYCPHKDKLKHKWFVDVTKLVHKQFNYLQKKLNDPLHIEFKKRHQLSDNLPNAPQVPGKEIQA